MAQYDFDAPEFSDELALEPRRTSVLAILSLVCGLVCVVPGMGVLAAIFGIAGLIGINNSRGRMGGTGLAVTGLILGLLFSMVWIGLLYAFKQGMGFVAAGMVKPAETALVAIEGGNFAQAKDVFTTVAKENMTDEELTKFRDAYQAEYGKFVSMPKSPMDAMQLYAKTGQAMQHFQGRNDMIPLPANFEKGPALVVFQIDQQGYGKNPPPTPGDLKMPFVNVIIAGPTGKQIDLYPINQVPALQRARTNTLPPSVPPADAPPPPDAPKDDKK